VDRVAEEAVEAVALVAREEVVAVGGPMGMTKTPASDLRAAMAEAVDRAATEVQGARGPSADVVGTAD
jgi:hypothetical protein